MALKGYKESINELIINKEIQKNDYHYFFLKEMSQSVFKISILVGFIKLTFLRKFPIPFKFLTFYYLGNTLRNINDQLCSVKDSNLDEKK